MTKKGQQKSTKNEKEVAVKDDKKTEGEEDAEEVNSGFANYLRSSTGLLRC